MPALKNPRHEQFVALIPHGAKNGWTQGEIYQRSGFKASGHSAEVAASRLMKRVDIRQRLAELSEPAVKRTKTTLDSLIGQFDQVFDGAMDDRQFGAAGSAATIKAKLTGFLRDKLEIGAPGDFANLETSEDVLDAIIAELGDGDPSAALAAFDSMRALLEGRAAGRAVNVTPDPPRDVVDRQALALLRSPRKSNGR